MTSKTPKNAYFMTSRKWRIYYDTQTKNRNVFSEDWTFRWCNSFAVTPLFSFVTFHLKPRWQSNAGDHVSNPICIWLKAPGDSENQYLQTVNRYHALDWLCHECDQIEYNEASHTVSENDCSNVYHVSSSGNNIFEHEHENSVNSACMQFEHRGYM